MSREEGNRKRKKKSCWCCGEIFDGTKAQYYCSPKCRNMANLKYGCMTKYVRASKLTQTLNEARASGMTYAEAQMTKTLQMAGGIKND